MERPPRGFSEEQFRAACRELDQPAPAAGGPWQLLVESTGVRIYRLYDEVGGRWELRASGPPRPGLSPAWGSDPRAGSCGARLRSGAAAAAAPRGRRGDAELGETEERQYGPVQGRRCLTQVGPRSGARAGAADLGSVFSDFQKAAFRVMLLTADGESCSAAVNTALTNCWGTCKP